MIISVTKPLLPSLKSLKTKLEEVLKSGHITNNGPQHVRLEMALKDYLEVDNISLFSNGTLALMIAIKALGLKGEIITTPFTFAATASTISWMDIKPVFCDINYDTMCIDANKIEALITKDTTAIIPVHVYGNICEVEKIEAIAKKHNLKVIYDAAHAFGSKTNKTPIGQHGDISMFSFHATKLFNTIEGGCLTFRDQSLKEKVELFKNFGIKSEAEVSDIGINSKLNEIQSVFGILNLELLAKERARREKIKKVYDSTLKKIDGIIINSNRSEIDSLQYYPIRIKKEKYGISRDELHASLVKDGIHARRYFYPLLSNTAPYKNLPSANKESLPIANQVAEEVLCLPFYGKLKISDAQMICNRIKSFKKN